MKKSIRNISLGILAAGTLLFCLDLATTAAQARTRVRQNGNTVTVTSTDSQGKNKQTTKIASGNGDYQISYSMPDGGKKNYLITGGKPLNTTLYYGVYLYNKAFNQFEMGYGSAMAWFMLLIIAFFTALIFRSSSAWVYYESEGR